MALLLIVPAFWGCKDDMAYDNDGVTATTLIAPDNNAAVELFNVESAKVDFEWNSTVGGVYYQLAFYGEDGKEIYRITPEGRVTTVAVSHQTLNELAHLAGIAPRTTGNLRWGVITVKGLLETASEQRTLTVSSYTAFNDLPVSLYITGPGSEGGTEASAAAPFRITGEGTYEIYTFLKAGEGFYFTNKNTPGGGRAFTVKDDFLVEGSDAMTVATEGVYLITLNFITAKMTTTAITNVRYFVPNTNTYTPMTYKGYGKWEHAVTPGNLTSSNNQYKFVANVGGTDRSWGCNTQAGQGSPPQILEGDYFYVYQNTHNTGSSSRARYSYRYMTELSNQPVTLTLDMSANNDHYTHVVDAGDLTVYPVDNFIAPAEGAAVALSKVAGSSLQFEWTPSSGTGPTPKYTVIFYSDAAGTNEIGTAAAGNNGFDPTAVVLHSALEPIAAAAGIPAEGTGELWWSVQTTVLTASEIAAIPPRKLIVTRFPGIPATVYITGAASEAGTTLSNAFVMKKTAAGVFEIYTRLTSGSTYCFVDRTTGTPRQFSVNGTAIIEGGSTTPASAGIYKIVLDFNTDVATYAAVAGVQFFHPWGSNRVTLTYTSNGVWTGSVTPSGWATDERYKFKVLSAASVARDWVGAGRRDSAPTGSPDFYYTQESECNLGANQYTTEWSCDDGNMWKIPGIGGWNANTFQITFSLRADAPYTHMVTW